MSRHLEYAEPDFRAATLVLIENDTTPVKQYVANRSFRRIQYRDRWFRLNGRDRATGEMVYLPEVV